MKDKVALASFLFLIIFLMGFSTSSVAVDYNMGLTEDAEFTYTINVLDEESLEKIFGNNWDNLFRENDEVGKKSKVVITKIDDKKIWSVEAFIIEVDIWEWTDEEFDNSADDELEYTIPKDPEELGEDWTGAPNFIPTPVADYLNGIDWGTGWSSEGVTIRYNGESSKEEKYSEVFTYDSANGILIKHQILDENNQVIYESGSFTITPYLIPIFIGVGAVGAIAIIYIIWRKRRGY